MRPWLEAMGFADPEDDVRVPDDKHNEDDDDENDDLSEPAEPAPPILDAEPYPRSDDHAPGGRLKLPILALGTVALVPVGGVLLAAAYLSGFDRSLPPKPAMVEAVMPTVVAPAPQPSPAPPLAAPDVAAVPPPPKAPRVIPPVRQSQPAPSTFIPLPASPDVATLGFPGGPATRARVVIHIPDDDAGSGARLDEVSSRLAPNVGRLETRHVAAGPSAREIRFFHAEDSAAAHAVAEMLSRLKGAWRVRNFTSFRPSPSEGTLEVWLPSSRAAPAYAPPPGG